MEPGKYTCTVEANKSNEDPSILSPSLGVLATLADDQKSIFWEAHNFRRGYLRNAAVKGSELPPFSITA